MDAIISKLWTLMTLTEERCLKPTTMGGGVLLHGCGKRPTSHALAFRARLGLEEGGQVKLDLGQSFVSRPRASPTFTGSRSARRNLAHGPTSWVIGRGNL